MTVRDSIITSSIGRKLLVLIMFFIGTLDSHAQSTDVLSVVSWNVFLRPGILQDEQAERTDSIANYLLKTDADVLVLQEVFHRKSRTKLKQLLSKKYPHQSKVGKTSFWGISSGVMLFSKHQILEENHISFSKGTGSDRLAKKGGVSIIIKFRNKLTQIIGTHLQAGNGLKRMKIRRQQIQKLKKLNKNENEVSAIIYAGDFNIDHRTEAYLNMLEILNCSNKSPKSSIKTTANFSDQELIQAKGSSKWIDFILIRKKKNAKIKTSVIQSPRYRVRNKKKRLSDHNPILSEIEIK